MIEVFATDINDQSCAQKILDFLSSEFPDYEVNIDLHDCDNILRVVCRDSEIDSVKLMEMVQVKGHKISILPD